MNLVLGEEERLPWLECVCQGSGEKTGSRLGLWGKGPGHGPVGGSRSLFGLYSSLSSGAICSAHLAKEDAVASHCLSNFCTAFLCVLVPWLMWEFPRGEKGMMLIFMGRVVQEAPPVAEKHEVTAGPGFLHLGQWHHPSTVAQSETSFQFSHQVLLTVHLKRPPYILALASVTNVLVKGCFHFRP